MVGKGLAYLSHNAEEKSMTRYRGNWCMLIPKGAAASHNIPLSGKIRSFEESVCEVFPSPSLLHAYSFTSLNMHTHRYTLHVKIMTSVYCLVFTI